MKLMVYDTKVVVIQHDGLNPDTDADFYVVTQANGGKGLHTYHVRGRPTWMASPPREIQDALDKQQALRQRKTSKALARDERGA